MRLDTSYFRTVLGRHPVKRANFLTPVYLCFAVLSLFGPGDKADGRSGDPWMMMGLSLVVFSVVLASLLTFRRKAPRFFYAQSVGIKCLALLSRDGSDIHSVFCQCLPLLRLDRRHDEDARSCAIPVFLNCNMDNSGVRRLCPHAWGPAHCGQ